MASRLTHGLVIPAALVLGLSVSACGSSKSTTALSKPEFLKKGNAICRRGNQEVNVEAKKAFPNNKRPTRAQAAKFANVVIPIIQSEISQIRGLPAPSGDEATVKKIIATAQTDLDRVKADPASLAGNSDPFKDANKLTNAYGLTACGAGG